MTKISAHTDTAESLFDCGAVKMRIVTTAFLTAAAAVFALVVSSPGAAASPGGQPSVQGVMAVGTPLRGDFAIQNKVTKKCADVPGFGRGVPRSFRG